MEVSQVRDSTVTVLLDEGGATVVSPTLPITGSPDTEADASILEDID